VTRKELAVLVAADIWKRRSNVNAVGHQEWFERKKLKSFKW